MLPQTLFRQAIELWLEGQQDTRPYQYSEAELQPIMGLPPERWPTAGITDINWDLSVQGHRYTIDPPEPMVLQPIESPPLVLILGKATVADCDPQLLPAFRRARSELWSVLDNLKLARAIAHIAHGRPLSPLYLCPFEQGGLFLGGGNHRYEVLKYAGVSSFYFLADREDMAAIDSQLPVNWIINSAVAGEGNAVSVDK